ncbi:hypothetical protein KSC_026520 [Ktedonobacter sp. SOSP1-52]|uniref:helix-turn-helix domain-containing protein n=1 Tax=Ktedonobacter sp. SOSP1-52 TaxID=2778366 RepID=UPI0019155D2D|nr:helix-turn-helix domain-containing protein [Ktedonobacter sp. SOSP1-52]GHO63760.1 hypothetical protein KSC_026520 [Ktedonobacter sp. SOSP1-52]
MEILMTTEEVAHLLHVEPITIRRLIMRGELAAYRIASEYRIDPADLAHYLKRQRLAGTAGAPGPALLVRLFEQGDAALNDMLLADQKLNPLLFSDALPLEEVEQWFGPCSRQTKMVLTLAEQAVRNMRHEMLGTEHLLLALLQAPDSNARQRLRLDADRVRQEIIRINEEGTQPSPSSLLLTQRVQKALIQAVIAAYRLQSHVLEPEHLLEGLLQDKEGIVAGIVGHLQIGPGVSPIQTTQDTSLEERNEMSSLTHTSMAHILCASTDLMSLVTTLQAHLREEQMPGVVCFWKFTREQQGFILVEWPDAVEQAFIDFLYQEPRITDFFLSSRADFYHQLA